MLTKNLLTTKNIYKKLLVRILEKSPISLFRLNDEVKSENPLEAVTEAKYYVKNF